ncbi:hypothetical protein LSH36_740g01072 [Paralvinella palmiformis]|uniref:Uncharacterized protein n=1 Tax=Paralvinella palmiformis TaxID=53620 RepID=A0AAD9J1M0_9ANNE|nr:hypothetical protein LSH36_740g01072 [Paralvinella palmiformis]
MAEKNESRVAENKPSTKSWSQIWYDFGTNTSLHGLKQIVEHQPYVVRRFIWLLLVLTGLALFLYQMTTAIIYYHSYPVSVNVKINYNKSIRFPAVTICNQNGFRKTVSVEHGWYYLLSDIFSADDVIDLDQYDVQEVKLYDIYDITGHSKESLIARCYWDSQPCSVDDFVMLMTDYGKCYTFNADLERQRRVWRTGAEGGLRLLLNVEQYEYMPGPNQGAGVRIHIHDQQEVPLMKDFGLAVAPGTHSLIGMTMNKVNNLPRPYGVCDDSRNMNYFKLYTKINCIEECRWRHLESHCDCRHIDMGDMKGLFKLNRSSCDCPIPCKMKSFEMINSVGKISEFDALNLLNSPLTAPLQLKYLRAAEVTQKVNNKIVENDNLVVRNLQFAVQKLDKSLDLITRALSYLEVSIDDLFHVLDQRIDFHRVTGLNKVKYIMEHDFVRGWTIIEERTLPYLTFGFYEIRSSYRRVINKLQNSKNGTEQEKILALASWQQMENIFLEKLEILQRASDNITDVHNAYKSGEPLLTYISSLHRRYDMTWITIDLLQARIKDKGYDQDKYYEKIFWRMGQINDTIRTYLLMVETFMKTGTINESLWDDTDWLFRKSCIQYNYYVFLYKDRIINGPVDVIDEKIREFDLLNRNMLGAKEALLMTTRMLRDTILTTMNTSWCTIRTLQQDAMMYISDKQIRKTNVARTVISETVTHSVEDIKQFFSTLRSSGLNIQDKIQRLQSEVEHTWINMLTEYTTAPFYRKVHDDFVAFLNDSKFYLPYFANLLDIEVESLYNVSASEIECRLNADFSVTNIQDKIQTTEVSFIRIRNWTNIARILEMNDESLMTVLEIYRISMEKFLKEATIDTTFYLNNFIELDIFMRELSYQEITQHHAYEITNLLGDIGGYVGLFMGASALTFAEIFDILIIRLLQVSCRF